MSFHTAVGCECRILTVISRRERRVLGAMAWACGCLLCVGKTWQIHWWNARRH